jgi:hypothetical protein
MRFDLVTCAWGPWHIDIMTRIMWPTLLASGNLPALAERFPVRYRISTTHADKTRIEALPIFRSLTATVPVEMVVDTEETNPDPTHHVQWYHKAVQQAREAGALCAFVPPDVAWSDGTFANMGAAMAGGKLATAMPYLRVISETCLPEMCSMITNVDGILSIPSGNIVRLGVRHLHPLTASALARGRHGRPSLEMLWRVPDEGLLLRHVVRELFSFDPQRITLTHLWYAAGGCAASDLHIVEDSDDMMMLSFAPLLKDIPLYIQDHAVHAMDVARSSLHPWNDSPFNNHFPRHRIRLHYGPVTESRWRRMERLSDSAFKQVLVMREILQIWQALKNTGACENICRVLALALQDTTLARRWPIDGSCTAFVPTDLALAAMPAELLDKTASKRLQRWVLDHVVAGHIEAGTSAGTSVTALSGGRFVVGLVQQTLMVGRHFIHLLDHLPAIESRT